MRKLITENFWLKISAVLISLFLWFFVTSRGQSEISFEVPLEFKNIPANIGIANASVKNVSVTVRGHERTMKNLKASDVRVYVNLDKAKKGEGTFYVNTNDVKLPYSLSATNVNPSSVRIKLDETISVTVRVKPVLSGQPENGFFVGPIRVEPKNVVLKGLKSEVRKLRILKTEPLDITDLNKTLTQEVNIDTGGANVSPEPGVVKVTINITEKKR
ncbi:MAG: CdaR family protein [Nitrospirota bacterium]|nr:CdaR family protein [Nitrospirota bacterium]